MYTLEITEEERQLLIQTVLQTNYAGQLAQLVVSVLEKLQSAVEQSEDARAPRGTVRQRVRWTRLGIRTGSP